MRRRFASAGFTASRRFSEAGRVPEQRAEAAEAMADAIGGSMRPIMVPTPLLRFLQRLDVRQHHRAT